MGAIGIVRFGRERDDRAACLGHAIGMNEAAAEHRQRAAQDALADWGGAIAHPTDGIGDRSAGFGMFDQPLDHGGDEEGMRDPVADHQFHDRGGIELLGQHRMPALAETHHPVAKSADVEQRHGREVDAVRAEAPRGADAAVVRVALVSQNDTLGGASGARGVEQQQRIITVVRDRRIGLAHTLAPRLARRAELDLAQQGRGLGQQGQEIGRDEDQRGGAIGKDPGDFACRQPPV